MRRVSHSYTLSLLLQSSTIVNQLIGCRDYGLPVAYASVMERVPYSNLYIQGFANTPDPAATDERVSRRSDSAPNVTN